MPIKKDKKKSKTIVVKKKSTKGKTSQSQSITVNINKGKSAPKQPSGKPTIASSIASLANVIRAQDFYRPSYTPTVVAPVGAVRTPVGVAVSTQVEEPMRKSIAVQSEPEPFILGSGRIKLPTREPVSIKLPPQELPPKRASSPLKRLVQNVERNRMAEEERISRDFLPQGPSLKPYYQGTSAETVTIKRPRKQEKPQKKEAGSPLTDIIKQAEESRAMTRADIESAFMQPLYIGGQEIQDIGRQEVPEPKIKRSYTKSGKYSKKQPSLIPVVTGEEEESFYPTKPTAELSARFGEPETLY